MDIEFEHKGIEELLTSDNDEYVPVTVTLKGQGEFLAYITPLKYGDLPKNAEVDDYKLGRKVLLEHIFKSNKEPFSLSELDKLPAGWVSEFVEAIKQISGFDETQSSVKDF